MTPETGSERRPWLRPETRTALRRVMLVVVVAGGIVLIGSWTRRWLGVDLEVDSVRRFAEGLGPAGPILFTLLVAGRAALALPSQVVLIAAGLCFGPWTGTLVGGVGLTISGLAVFLATRYAGREAVERRLRPRAGRLLELAGNRGGAVALALGTAYPIAPLSLIQAAAGLTAMTWALFLVAAFVGAAARAATFSWFGHALAEASLTGLLLATLAFAAFVLLPLATPGGRRWVRGWLAAEASVAESDAALTAHVVTEAVTHPATSTADAEAGPPLARAEATPPPAGATPPPAGEGGSAPSRRGTRRSAPN